MTMYQLKKSGMETVETGTPTHKLNTIDSLHTEGDNTADFSQLGETATIQLRLRVSH